jgi:ubiquinone/menaquinone biosynthesis C-methylase UbiE
VSDDDHGWSGYVEDSWARLEGGELADEYRRLIAPYLATPPARVLDVGTGPGHFLVAMHALAPAAELHGTDVSERHLEIARADLARRGVRAQLIAAGGNRLPYPDARFDLVICQAVMPYSYDDRGFLDELTRVLRPGGVLWFQTHGLGFYLVRIVSRSPVEKLRYTASVVSGVVSMLSGWKPLNDTPVTVGWLRSALARAGCAVQACEWSRYRSIPKLIRASAVKSA